MNDLVERFDYDTLFYSADDLTAKKFMDDVYEAAESIPKHVFMNESVRWFDPIVELAYKLYLDKGEKN